MRKLIILIIILIISSNLFAQKYDPKLINQPLKDLSSMFGSSMFGCDHTPDTDDELYNKINSTTNGGGYTSMYNNWFTSSFNDHGGNKYAILIGFNSHDYKIMIFSGALDLILVSTITFRLGSDYSDIIYDNLYSSSQDYTIIDGKALWVEDTNIIIQNDEVPNVSNYRTVYNSKYIKLRSIHKIAIAFNPFTTIGKKYAGLFSVYNKIKAKSY